MIKNYLKIAIVSIRKNIFSSAINILGLALGLSLCLLIIMIIKDELSYDKFHPSRHKVYRVNTRVVHRSGDNGRYATTTYPLGATLKERLPFVESVVRL